MVLVRDIDVWAGATNPEHVIMSEEVSVTCESCLVDLLMQSRAGAVAGRLAISCGCVCIRREGHPDWVIRCTVNGIDRISRIDDRSDGRDQEMKPDNDRSVRFTYTNYRRVTRERHVIPLHIAFEACPPWYMVPRWLLYAHDLDRSDTRAFALDKIQNWASPPIGGT